MCNPGSKTSVFSADVSPFSAQFSSSAGGEARVSNRRFVEEHSIMELFPTSQPSMLHELSTDPCMSLHCPIIGPGGQIDCRQAVQSGRKTNVKSSLARELDIAYQYFDL